MEIEKLFADGFTEEADIFNRKPLFDNIMQLINDTPESGLVLAIDNI